MIQEGNGMGEENKKKSYEVGELDHYLFGKGNHYEIYKNSVLI